MIRRSCAASALVVLLSARGAGAGERSPLSSLPLAPPSRPLAGGAHGITGLTLKEQQPSSPRRWIELNAATRSGYCLASTAYGLHLSASTAFSAESDDELWRFVEAEDGATLERTRFEVVTADNELRAKSRTTTTLSKVASAGRVKVWGLREPSGDILLLAAGESASGRESEGFPRKDAPDGMPPMVWSSCTYGATRIAGKQAKAGAIALLRVSLPAGGEGKPGSVFIHASVAQLSRDPEPLVSIRVTVDRPN